MSHDIQPDGPLTPEQEALARALSAEFIEKIDATLLSQVLVQWRKVAMVVGMAMSALENRRTGIPDIYYAQRVRFLVERGELEARGDPSRMRYSEVRRLTK
jgi:hypothetical protein